MIDLYNTLNTPFYRVLSMVCSIATPVIFCFFAVIADLVRYPFQYGKRREIAAREAAYAAKSAARRAGSN